MRSACMDAGSAGDKGRGSTREDLVWVGELGARKLSVSLFFLTA